MKAGSPAAAATGLVASNCGGNGFPRGFRRLLKPGDPRSVKLGSEARAGSDYFVTFETFPHGPGWGFSRYPRSDGDGLIIVVPIWLASALVSKVANDAKDRKMWVEWAHINVISADPAEGRVERVRVEAKERRFKRGNPDS